MWRYPDCAFFRYGDFELRGYDPHSAIKAAVSRLSFLIREAEPRDAPAILRLIRALAEYEKMLDDVHTDEARIGATLFDERRKAFCDIAEVAGEPVGYAIWLYSYSTFSGRHGIYLEDLFVLPEHRGSGIGKASPAGSRQALC